MEPATSIIKAFGGPSKVAVIAAVHRTRVSNWMRPKKKGGTGGRVPQRHIETLLVYAREHQIQIRVDDFFPSSPSPRAEAAA